MLPLFGIAPLSKRLLPTKPILSCLAVVLLLAGSAAYAAPPQWLAQLKPEANPDLRDLPDDTWKRLEPKGDPFDHPKTEVGLVYDERLGGMPCASWPSTR